MSYSPCHGAPRQRKKRNFFIAALDCETVPWNDNDPPSCALNGKPVFITACHEIFGVEAVSSYWSFGDFLADIFSHIDPAILARTIWYSHNGEYDWRYLIPYLEPYSDRFKIRLCERAEGIFYEIFLYDVPDPHRPDEVRVVTRFRDSMAIFPRSLRDFTEAFAPDYPKGSFDFEKERFDRLNPDHVAYAERDVISLVMALQRYDQFIYEHFGVHLKATAASIAYAAWLRTVPRDTIFFRQGLAAERFFRDGYIGGMVQINAEKSVPYTNVSCFDINSSYPASMRDGVPIGKCKTAFRYQPGKPGFYKVKFRIRSDFVLPVIAHKGEKGLCFPINATADGVETICASHEIAYARSLGYRFDIDEGYYWDEIGFPFNRFIDLCEELRGRFKAQPTEYVIKLLQNSLYGRFAMREESREIQVNFKENIQGSSGWRALHYIGPNEEFEVVDDVYWRPQDRMTEYMLPHWSAWITASGRILLDRGCRKVGIERCLYRDTDGVFIVGQPNGLDIGPSYGQFKLEKVCREWRGHAPKYYSYIDQSGEVQVVCKGMVRKNMTAEFKQALHENKFDVDNNYLSTTGVLTWLKTGELEIARVRRQTRAENVYSHVVIAGKFRPRRL